MSNAKNFFSKEDDQQIVNAIREAERNTSGEIRVHIENRCEGEVLDRATAIFQHLGMNATDQRNGVLFYLAVRDHRFAILGDEGIDKTVPEGFWLDIRSGMEARFKNGEFLEGLSEGIRQAGEQLKVHFPWKHDDKNELPDELSYGE